MRHFCYAAWLLLLGFYAVPARAQSVSPPIAEYQGRARSSFQLHNPTLFPITVVLELRGFSITDRGEVLDIPFDTSRVRVKLSEMSFRIPPRASRRVFYEASSDSLPAWFNILSAMSGAKTETGLNVRILLPHVVYLNQKQPLRREDVELTAFEYDSAASLVRVGLRNRSPNLGRVYQLSIEHGRHASQSGGGFPLLPHQQRWIEAGWEASARPNRLVLRFSRFTIDTVLPSTAAHLETEQAAAAPRP